MVLFYWKSLLDEKRSIPDIHFFILESEHGSFTGELSWLRTTVTSLEYTGRVSVYASVVKWLLSSRQSPTVASSGWAVSLQRLTYWTRGWEHAVSTALDGSSWTSWWCKCLREMENGRLQYFTQWRGNRWQVYCLYSDIGLSSHVLFGIMLVLVAALSA